MKVLCSVPSSRAAPSARVQQRAKTAPGTQSAPVATPAGALPSVAEALKRGLAGAMAAVHVSVGVLPMLALPPPAEAVLNSPNAQIARSSDAALRRSIPAFNPDVRNVQKKMEEVAFYLRIPQRKPWASMSDNVAYSTTLLRDSPAKALEGVPADARELAEGHIADALKSLGKLNLAIGEKNPDKTSVRVAEVLKSVAELEKLQAPGLAFLIPKEFRTSPYLTGRAVARFQVEKADKSAVFLDLVNGGSVDTAVIDIELDGYSAPVSAGAFAANVLSGMYNDQPVSASFNSLIAGTGLKPSARVPLEILPIGDLDPLYKSPLDTMNGELPVLPLSINGAVAFTRTNDDAEDQVSGDEWFVFKFDPTQAGLGGLSFDEGKFGVFGYVIGDGMDSVKRLSSGDKIVSATIISGADKLVNAPPL